MEILTGALRRRRWSSEEKLEILREASAPGSSVGAVARRHDISRSQIYQWRRAFRAERLAMSRSLLKFSERRNG
jgi:transposase